MNMRLRKSGTFFDPREGDEPFMLRSLKFSAGETEPPRSNYFSVYLIDSGAGTFWADAAQFPFRADSLLFFVPYQHIRFVLRKPVRTTLLQFHANFLCVETFHAEVGCSGVLFNDPYSPPIVELDGGAREEVSQLVARIREEYAARGLAYQEVLLSYLRVLLILATRIKNANADRQLAAAADPRDPVLAELRELIEQHYRELHAPSDYAALLHRSPKTLGRIVREKLGKTLTDLIRERILTHAKWQLLHTLRPVKEIAAEIGYQDELYFSRLFKKATGVSPTYFREFETEIRGGSNLSMLSSDAPIQQRALVADHL